MARPEQAGGNETRQVGKTDFVKTKRVGEAVQSSLPYISYRNLRFETGT